jgi:SAM-dependent methyltransferase
VTRQTIAAYERAAPTAIANWAKFRTPSRFLRRFVGRMPAGARVLDYGCGIGTDMAWMRRHGLRVEGLDGTRAFVAEARRRCPGAAVRVARFETVRLPARRFDGIWCNAALIHVPPAELPRQLRRLRDALTPGGLLAVSLAWGRSCSITRRDWIPGRFIAAYSNAQALAFLDEGWAHVAARVVDHDGRQGRWIQLVATPAA